MRSLANLCTITRRFQRERIILGLAVACVIFSLANIIPIGYNGCGRAAVAGPIRSPLTRMRTPPGRFTLMMPRGYVAVRGLWFLSKYGMACYELFALVASVHALRRRRPIEHRVEVLCHMLCFAISAVVLVVWLANGYDRSFHRNDPVEVARYQTLLYDLMGIFLDGWLALAGVAMLLWVYVEAKFHQLRAHWRRSSEAFSLLADDVERCVVRGCFFGH